MKRIWTLVLFVKLIAPASGQEGFYDYLKPGEYAVGCIDTIILDKKMQYDEYGYLGMKPYFVTVWHPIKASENPVYIPFGELLKEKVQAPFNNVYQQLRAICDSIVFWDALAENIETGEEYSFGEFSFQEVYRLIKKAETRSMRTNGIARSEYPIIIYHHGSQSTSIENFAMAEYFASRGFIFVSSNFHLPYPNTLFGMKPYDKIVLHEDEESLKTVIEYAQSLSSSKHIFFIGHSWGVQMGWRTLNGEKKISGFVSMETTIEFKEDKEVIRDLWPEVYQKIEIENSYYPFPVLLFAATGKTTVPVFFDQASVQKLIFAPTDESFDHNAYTSVFYSRLFLNGQMEQSDLGVLRNKFKLYVRHLEFMERFFGQIIANSSGDKRIVEYIGY